jgi:hypothetical protein
VKVHYTCLPILLGFLIFATQAHAQSAPDSTPTPDKSEYNLLNPVPDDQLRSFETDRPTKSNTPYTVDAGHFQYESDIVNSTYDHYSPTQTTTSDLIVADPTLKVGVTNNIDLEVALAPFNFDRTTNRTTHTQTNAYGFGDVYTRAKFNLLGNDGGDYVLAVVPYVEIPTSAHNVGNSYYGGGAYAPLTFALPDDWTGLVMTEVDILENAAANGTHANYENLINFSHPLSKSVTGYVEFSSDVNTDPGISAQTQYTVDFATSWLVTDNFQLDCGINVGANKAAPDLQTYIGISQRF